ncbi:MAG TPA: RDD family protein [Rhodanobacteraceae bacterium]
MQQWSVTLTGELKPGIDAATAWPSVAKVLERDPATFAAEILKRLPMTSRRSDENAAMVRWQALDACGVKSLLLPDAGQELKIRLEGTARGPVSVEFARRQLESGAWSGQTEACPEGQSEWMSLRHALRQGDDYAGAPGGVSGAAPRGPRALHELPTHIEDSSLHAGFWRRVAAYLVDFLIIAAPLWLLDASFGHGAHSPAGRLGTDFFKIALLWLYWAGFESSGLQATPGKLVLGLSVVDMQGMRIGFLHATGRYFGKLLSSLILCVGYMMAGWTERKQALHDLLAHTCVVQKRDLAAILSTSE